MGANANNCNEVILAVVSGAMVYCDCAPKLPSDDINSEVNYELYRELIVNKECTHGVFGEDAPLLHEKDCKPFINLKPFNSCKSGNYISAMEGIMSNLKKNKSSKIAEYSIYLDKAKNQYAFPVENGIYTCVLEVLDRWFEADDKHYVNNYFTVSSEILDKINKLKNQLKDILKKVRKEYEKSLPNIFEQIEAAIANGFAPDLNKKETIYFVDLKKGGILERLKNSYDKYNELKAFKKNALIEFDSDKTILFLNLDNLAELLEPYVHFGNDAKGEFNESKEVENKKKL